MTGDLVAFSIHAADDTGPCWCGINGTFTKVVTSDEESGLEAICVEFVKDTGSEAVWTIIVGDCNCTRPRASIDTCASIPNAALLRASIVRCGCSARSLVAITSRAIVDQTIWSSTVIF